MKYLKRIALLTVAALCAICAGVFAAACNKEVTEFTVTVYYSDGETVVDGENDPMKVQICIEQGRVNFCSTTTPDVDKNGQAKFSISGLYSEIDGITNENGEDPVPESERVFILHVIKSGEGLLDLTEDVYVSKDNPNVKIVLADKTAP